MVSLRAGLCLTLLSLLLIYIFASLFEVLWDDGGSVLYDTIICRILSAAILVVIIWCRMPTFLWSYIKYRVSSQYAVSSTCGIKLTTIDYSSNHIPTCMVGTFINIATGRSVY